MRMSIEQDFETVRGVLTWEGTKELSEMEATALDALSRIERDREDWKLAAGAEAEIADEFKAERDALKAKLEETELTRNVLWAALESSDIFKATLEKIESGYYLGEALTPEGCGVPYKVRKRMSRRMMKRIARQALEEEE
jgi:hypothetical protein